MRDRLQFPQNEGSQPLAVTNQGYRKRISLVKITWTLLLGLRLGL